MLRAARSATEPWQWILIGLSWKIMPAASFPILRVDRMYGLRDQEKGFF